MINRRDLNRAIRIAMGKTQKEVGEIAGVTASTVQRYETKAEGLTPASIKVIDWAYTEILNGLSDMEKAKVKLAANSILLMEAQAYIDKVDCLQSILFQASMILKNETTSMRFGIRLIKEHEE